eukprot:gene17830-24213_t
MVPKLGSPPLRRAGVSSGLHERDFEERVIPSCLISSSQLRVPGFRLRALPPPEAGPRGSVSSSPQMVSCIRKAFQGDRERVRKFVSDVHVDSSSYSPESRALQISELPTDFPELFDEELWRPFDTWVSEISGAPDLHGTVALHPCYEADAPTGCLTLAHFFVHESTRKQGLGTKLLRLAMAEAQARGAPCVRLLTLRGVYDPAIRLYAREGFAVRKEFDSPDGMYRLVYMEAIIAQN